MKLFEKDGVTYGVIDEFNIRRLLAQYQNGNYMVYLFDDGTKVRETEGDDFIPAFSENTDVCLTKKCYNFGPDDASCVTTGELATLFCSAWKEKASWKNVSDANAPHEANFLKLQCEKSKNVLGWYPKWNIRHAIDKIVEWEKAVQNGTPAAEIKDKQIREYFEL